MLNVARASAGMTLVAVPAWNYARDRTGRRSGEMKRHADTGHLARGFLLRIESVADLGHGVVDED